LTVTVTGCWLFAVQLNIIVNNYHAYTVYNGT